MTTTTTKANLECKDDSASYNSILLSLHTFDMICVSEQRTIQHTLSKLAWHFLCVYELSHINRIIGLIESMDAGFVAHPIEYAMASATGQHVCKANCIINSLLCSYL